MIFNPDLLALLRLTDGSEPCATTDPDLWHAPDDLSTGQSAIVRRRQTIAKTYCQGCHLIDECAAYALTHSERGVWGGLDERDRDDLLRTGAA